MIRTNRYCTLNLTDCVASLPGRVTPASSPIQRRLAEAVQVVEAVDRQRARGERPFFAAIRANRLIWRELLELELQDIDEQLEQISAMGGNLDGQT